MSFPARAMQVSLFFAAIMSLGAQTMYTGTIGQRLAIVDGFGSWATFGFKSASNANLQSLPASADRSGSAYAGRLPVTNIRVVITDSPTHGAIVYADLNRDDKYSSDEQFPFYRLPGNSVFTADPRGWPAQKTCFNVPVFGKSFQQSPACIELYDQAKSTYADGSRSLDLGISPWVTGSVIIGSRRVNVGYEYDLEHDSVDPMNGGLGLRESAEGPIDFLSGSPETAYAEKERIVFRAGDMYLSTVSIDLKQHRVVLRSHPAADYIRVELRPGTAIPDWSFVDLNGQPGNLKSHAGKYVMLDIWTPSCGPCLGEFEMLKAMVRGFGSRTFEILGVLGDADEVQARREEKEHGLIWRTAASGTTLEYAQKRLRIASWPTHILLDPNGRIVSTSDSELRGAALQRTLQALLPHLN
jgi:thiol-disulfide isomerase/thioredoxin